MESISCCPLTKSGINMLKLKDYLMKKTTAAALLLTGVGAVFSANAQKMPSDAKLLAANNNPVERTISNNKTKPLTKPDVKEGTSYEAALASKGTVTIHVMHGAQTEKPPEFYAKHLVNGFARQDVTKNKAMYIEGYHSDKTTLGSTHTGTTYVTFRINGHKFNYNGEDSFTLE